MRLIVKFHLLSHNSSTLQAYFLYWHIETSYETHRPTVRNIVVCTAAYIALYSMELYFIVNIFEDIKRMSVANNTLENSAAENSELFSIFRLEQNFKFAAFGLEEFGNVLLGSVSSLFNYLYT